MPRRKCDATDRLIGRNIRFHRLRRGLSQQQLAGALHISWQQLQKYEHGSNRIAASTLLVVSRVLNVSLDALVERRP